MTLALIIVSLALIVMSLAFYGADQEATLYKAERDAACDCVDDLSEQIDDLLGSTRYAVDSLILALNHAISEDHEAAFAVMTERFEVGSDS